MNLVETSFGGPALVRSYCTGDPSAVRFYPGGSHRDPGVWQSAADGVDRTFDLTGRQRLARMVSGGGPDRVERLRRFVEEGGLAVTTGQQPGLFGGPLYAVYKAFTAAALARRLEHSLGRPVLPVFWVASEDHDWDEARRSAVPDVDNDLVELQVPVPPEGSLGPLHRTPMGAGIDEALARLSRALPDTEFSPRWMEHLEACYRADATFPDAFEAFLRPLFDRAGIFTLQAHEPEAKEATLELLLSEARDAEARESALARRGHELTSAGHDLQVPLLDGALNLFLEGPGGRERLFRESDGALRLRRSGQRLTFGELEARAAADPTVLSPGVLLRPVVERALVPTLAYVAGPGETAYLAQVGPLFSAHGLNQPVVVPRWSGVVLERKVGKVMDRFDLPLEAFQRPEHELAGEVLRDEVPDDVRQALGGFRGDVARQTRALDKAVQSIDPTLSGPVESMRNQAFQLASETEKKVVQALKRDRESALAQLRKASLHLFPGGQPQERVLTPMYHLVRYGDRAIDAWIESARSAAPSDVGMSE